MMLLIDIFLLLAAAYLLGGVLFAGYFYWRGAQRIDDGTAGTPWHFKAIIFPGVVLFWLPLLTKLLKKS